MASPDSQKYDRIDQLADEFAEQVEDQFDLLYREADTGGGRILSLTVHPWLIGQPHRIGGLERALGHVMARAGVWAATGAEIRRLGGTGSGPGQLDRPNGVRAIDDLLIVVERDNARLQAFSLPALQPLGTFGEEQLRRPYGIAAYQDDQGRIELYVTDNYELVEDQIPPDSALGERVEQFRVWLENGELRHEHVRTFGDTSGAGVLRKVETIGIDAPNDRVVIAEELEPDSHWKIYDLEGRFSGRVFGRGYFPHEAEGLALDACSDGGGYWIATDQDEVTNTFHVFDRRTFEHLGAFTGATTRNTDGVALTQTAFGPFPAGAFYAVHNDGNIAAFSWAQIAAELGLRSDCGG